MAVIINAFCQASVDDFKNSKSKVYCLRLITAPVQHKSYSSADFCVPSHLFPMFALLILSIFKI